MKFLCIDYGQKRIGVSMSDELGMFAIALDPIIYSNKLVANESLQSLIKKNNIDELVVGTPDTGRESEKKQIEKIKSFVDKFVLDNKIKVNYWNESFSSKDALRSLKSQGIKSRKRIKSNIDSESARIILQEFLDYQKTKI